MHWCTSSTYGVACSRINRQPERVVQIAGRQVSARRMKAGGALEIFFQRQTRAQVNFLDQVVERMLSASPSLNQLPIIDDTHTFHRCQGLTNRH